MFCNYYKVIKNNNFVNWFLIFIKKSILNGFLKQRLTGFCMVLCLCVVFFLFNCNDLFAARVGCGEDANPAIKTICDIIMFLQGRIARSLVAFSIMLAAWGFVGGNFKWQEMLTLAIGIGIFYAPQTFALFLLPEYIQGITGDGYDISLKYTPDEIITCACPNLR